MSEPEEDFASMFEASLQAKRVEKGQTIEGTIVAIGPEVAFVNVGGKGEATDRHRRTEERRRRSRSRGRRPHPGDGRVDRGRTDAVAEAGARRRDRRGSSKTRSSAGLPVEGKVERAVKGGYEVRIGRQRAFCPLSQIDIVRNTDPAAARRARLHIPHHRVQGRRPEPHRLAARAARGGAAGAARPKSGDRSSPARC